MEFKRIDKRLLYLLAVTLTIASCRVGQVETPKLSQLPEAYRYQQDTTGELSLPGYKDFFRNAGLQSILDTAWNANFDVMVALQQLESARLNRQQVGQNALPTVTASALAQSTRPADNSLNGLSVKNFLNSTHVEDFSVGAQIAWEADLWGKLHYQRKQARDLYFQSEEGLKSLRSKLILQLAAEYYRLVWMREQKALLNRNLELSDSILQAITGLQELGNATVIDLQLAKANKRRAAILVPVLEEQIGQTEQLLSVLTGKVPQTVATAGALNMQEFADSLIVGKPVALLQHKPSVRFAEMNIRIQAGNVGITTANLYPALQLSLATGLNSYQFPNWISLPGSLFGMVGGGLLQPVFQQKLLKTRQKQAAIQLETAFTQFKQEIYQSIREVADAQLKENTSRDRVTKGTELLEDLETAVDQARQSFQYGQISYLEVLTVQERWIQASLELSESQYQLVMSRINLYYALGGGQAP